MDFTKLLQGVDCACGKHHSCDIGFVAIERGAIRHLKRLCRGYNSILVVADGNTYAAAGEKTEKALAGKKLTRVIFSGSTVLIPNEDAIAQVQEALPGNALIVGIGSGVIQDLCKYVSFYSGIPYYIVATAPSMDGYASTGAAMITGGMKVTYSAKVPEAILADTEILKDAPFEMIQAGYGDIVGKYSALNDWKLSHAVNGEYLCRSIYDMIMEALEQTLKLADGLVKREEESVRVLMEALVLVGVAMSFTGSSRPASGSEHHLSHYFEITGILNDEPYFNHGTDVVYSTVYTQQLREELLKLDAPVSRGGHERAAWEEKIRKIYTEAAQGVIDLQDKMGWYEQDRLPVYTAKWDEIKSVLAEVPSCETIKDYIASVGLDIGEFTKLYSKEKIENALFYAKDLKDRYSVLWLYYDLMK